MHTRTRAGTPVLLTGATRNQRGSCAATITGWGKGEPPARPGSQPRGQGSCLSCPRKALLVNLFVSLRSQDSELGAGSHIWFFLHGFTTSLCCPSALCYEGGAPPCSPGALSARFPLVGWVKLILAEDWLGSEGHHQHSSEASVQESPAHIGRTQLRIITGPDGGTRDGKTKCLLNAKSSCSGGRNH